MDKLYIAIIVVAVLAIAVVSYKLFGLNKIKNWLVWAVTQAEKEFGTGTGKLKLAFVYNQFIDKFPKLQAFIPFSVFSKLVDAALVTMKEMLQNEKISEIVNIK